MTFISVAMVVNPSESHEEQVIKICGGIAIFAAVWLLVPALQSLFGERGRRSLSAPPTFWILLSAVAMLLLGISWGQTEDIIDGHNDFVSSWGVRQFVYFAFRGFLLGGMTEIFRMSKTHSFKISAVRRLLLFGGVLLCAVLCSVVP